MLTPTLSVPVMFPISILLVGTLVIVMAWISLLSDIGPEVAVILDTSSVLGCARLRVTLLAVSFNSLTIFGVPISECRTIILDNRIVVVGKA